MTFVSAQQHRNIWKRHTRRDNDKGHVAIWIWKLDYFETKHKNNFTDSYYFLSFNWFLTIFRNNDCTLILKCASLCLLQQINLYFRWLGKTCLKCHLEMSLRIYVLRYRWEFAIKISLERKMFLNGIWLYYYCVFDAMCRFPSLLL